MQGTFEDPDPNFCDHGEKDYRQSRTSQLFHVRVWQETRGLSTRLSDKSTFDPKSFQSITHKNIFKSGKPSVIISNIRVREEEQSPRLSSSEVNLRTEFTPPGRPPKPRRCFLSKYQSSKTTIFQYRHIQYTHRRGSSISTQYSMSAEDKDTRNSTQRVLAIKSDNQ